MPRTHLALLATMALIPLGAVGQNNLHPRDHSDSPRSDILIVQNESRRPVNSEDTAKDSAKMEGEESAQTGGANAKSEKDTDKVEQPARSNPPTGNATSGSNDKTE